MKKVLIVFCLCFSPFTLVYSQSWIDSTCTANLGIVFKTHDLKIKYETVQYIYKATEKKSSFIFPKHNDFIDILNHYCKTITGVPQYFEKQDDSISNVNHGELVEVKWMSEEEINRYVEYLNCTPEKAFKEYMDFIENIKLEKEIYLKCIDAELAKGDLSEYAKDTMLDYYFLPPFQSLIPPSITKLDFLKVFKEFIFSNNEEILPEGQRVVPYLSSLAFGQLIESNYANFTPERQSILEKMGEFFDKTVRDNFPAKTDSSSYKAFYNCIKYSDGVSTVPYVMQVNRKKLAKINTDLFKDENYYFFYAKYLAFLAECYPDKTSQHHNYNDIVPTIRYYTKDTIQTPTSSWSFFPYNPDGYMRRIVEWSMENPVVRNVRAGMALAGAYDINLFIINIFDGNLGKVSDPVVKQLGAVIFWRYICFCGGVDLVRRKGFCDECGSVE